MGFIVSPRAEPEGEGNKFHTARGGVDNIFYYSNGFTIARSHNQLTGRC